MYKRPYTIFSTFHPALLCLYALGAPILGMLSHLPWFLGISFLGAILVHTFWMGGDATWSAMKWMLPCIMLVGVFNMITNPRGLHEFVRIWNHPLTLEGLCYGIGNGVMFGNVVLWFRCFTAIVPNDKFLYLFGRKLPGTALLLSMILKLFPETRYRMTCIQMADRTKGMEQEASVREKIGKGLRQISILLEWSMEDSIEMADSMKARAYGMAGRTSYYEYHMTGEDKGMLVYMTGCLVGVGAGMLLLSSSFAYYPTFRIEAGQGGWNVLVGAAYLLFLLTPLWCELKGKGGRKNE